MKRAFSLFFIFLFVVMNVNAQPPLTPTSSKHSTTSASQSTRYMVVLDSDPSGATVIVDGINRGTSPLTLSLTPGTHKVKMEKRGTVAEKTITVKSDGENVWTLDLPNVLQTEVITVNGVCFKVIYVEGGTFTMGCTYEQSAACDDDENPTHSVKLSEFCMGETEVTQQLWKAVMGEEPTEQGGWTYQYGYGDDYPAYRVSWEEVQVFISKLNQMTGRNFRLPTEAEWEFAARGGNMSHNYKYSGSNVLSDVAWFEENVNKTHSVKAKVPNELGLYDMSGNVYEWCYDWYSDSYPSSYQTDPTGESTGTYRINRGGSWSSQASDCRVSYRHSGTPDTHGNLTGFRLAISNTGVRVPTTTVTPGNPASSPAPTTRTRSQTSPSSIDSMSN